MRSRSARKPRAPEEVERAELAFYVDYLRPGMTVFDVGAHIGDLSLLFARLVGPAGVVFAFEPAAHTHERLRRVIEASGRENVTVERLAVAETNGPRPFNFYGGDFASWSSLAHRDPATYGIPLDRIQVEEVTSTTLDGYCAAAGIERIDLLKVDSEGAEFQALLGARELLESKRIGACVFEFGQTTFDMGNDPRRMRVYLDSLGYTLRNLVNGEPVFPGGRRVETAEFSMHVATPW
jgi:FkbM family methyltransferase